MTFRPTYARIAMATLALLTGLFFVGATASLSKADVIVKVTNSTPNNLMLLMNDIRGAEWGIAPQKILKAGDEVKMHCGTPKSNNISAAAPVHGKFNFAFAYGVAGFSFTEGITIRGFSLVSFRDDKVETRSQGIFEAEVKPAGTGMYEVIITGGDQPDEEEADGSQAGEGKPGDQAGPGDDDLSDGPGDDDGDDGDGGDEGWIIDRHQQEITRLVMKEK